MKKLKGSIGYIKFKRIQVICTALVLFGLSFSMYFFGVYHLGTNKSLFTIIAVLGLLPASKQLVNVIMYFKARECKSEIAELTKAVGDNNILYELFFTTPTKSFTLDCICVYPDNIIAIASKKIDVALLEEYINKVLSSNGYSDVKFKIFDDTGAFLSRFEVLSQKNLLSDDDKIIKMANLLKIISL